MGRELFDFAFKTYAQRWAFRHPTPSDFFRTMEDASAVDLDWFWRGWFYSTEPVDISLDSVKLYRMNTHNPEIENKIQQAAYEQDAQHIANTRNRAAGVPFTVDQDTALQDFYSKYDRFAVSSADKAAYQQFYDHLSPEEKRLYDSNKNFYELTFSNRGGLVMPLIIEWTYADGTKDIDRISAYIWRKNENQVTKVFAKDKAVVAIRLDPYRETADIDETNNSYPRTVAPSRFELFRQEQLPRGSSAGGANPMQQALSKP